MLFFGAIRWPYVPHFALSKSIPVSDFISRRPINITQDLGEFVMLADLMYFFLKLILALGRVPLS